MTADQHIRFTRRKFNALCRDMRALKKPRMHFHYTFERVDFFLSPFALCAAIKQTIYIYSLYYLFKGFQKKESCWNDAHLIRLKCSFGCTKYLMSWSEQRFLMKCRKGCHQLIFMTYFRQRFQSTFLLNDMDGTFVICFTVLFIFHRQLLLLINRMHCLCFRVFILLLVSILVFVWLSLFYIWFFIVSFLIVYIILFVVLHSILFYSSLTTFVEF